jgi:hypothetical protein
VTIGGDVSVLGTAAAGEVIEIVRGDVTLDASFNAGGDTLVLAGDAGSYSAVLNGSFVTIEGGDVSVAMPVGIAGMAVQFGNSTRMLRVDMASGQVMLGAQVVTGAEQDVSASGPALVDAVEAGPDSFAKLILTQPGQDVDLGGNVSVSGTASGGEVVTVLSGSIRLDASFNAGGDTVVLAGSSGDYSASLSGSFVTFTDVDGSEVAIPVGTVGITIAFDDASATLRYDGASGEVRLGDDVISQAGSIATSQIVLGAEAIATEGGGGLDPSFDELFGPVPEFAGHYGLSAKLDFAQTFDVHRLDIDSFHFG